MRVDVTGDPAAFRELVFDFLLREPVRNTAILTQVQARATSAVVDPEPGVYVAVVDDGGEVVGAATHVRAWNQGTYLGELREDLVPAVADAFAKHAPDTPKIEVAPHGAPAVIRRWKAMLGTDLRQTVHKRLYRLGELRTPDVPGSARPAVPAEIDLLAGWVIDFNLEVGEVPRRDTVYVTTEIAAGLLWVWEHDGEVVSLAGCQWGTPGAPRVGPVYTPPEHRRHGYGSALTAHVSRLMLTEHEVICLYADLANLTSNRVYLALGYEPVCELVRLVPS